MRRSYQNKAEQRYLRATRATWFLLPPARLKAVP